MEYHKIGSHFDVLHERLLKVSRASLTRDPRTTYEKSRVARETPGQANSLENT